MFDNEGDGGNSLIIKMGGNSDNEDGENSHKEDSGSRLRTKKCI